MQQNEINTMNTPISQEMMEMLYQEYKMPLYRYTLSRVRHREVAEDIVSSAFMQFLKYLLKPDISKEHHYRGLLYKIAKNQIADHFNTSQKNQFVDVSELEITDEVSMSPLQEIDVKLSMEVVDAAMERLPEYYRELIRLRHIAQLEYSEIAELLNKKEGAIRVALHRAVKMAQDSI